MAECESLDGCPFFNDKLDDMPAMADMYKKKYCLGDKSSCARYIVKTEVGKDEVPSDLSPNQTERAQEIISNANL